MTIAVVSALVLLAVLFGPWSYRGPEVVSQTNGSARGAVSAPGENQYYFFASGQVCLDGEGSAKIISVEPVGSHGGLQVTDFAVLPHPSTERMGADPGRLRDDEAYSGPKTIAEVCKSGTSTSELYLELLKPRKEDAWAREFDLKYEIDDHQGSTRIQLGLGICEKKLDDCDTENGWSDES